MFIKYSNNDCSVSQFIRYDITIPYIDAFFSTPIANKRRPILRRMQL